MRPQIITLNSTTTTKNDKKGMTAPFVLDIATNKRKKATRVAGDYLCIVLTSHRFALEHSPVHFYYMLIIDCKRGISKQN